MKINTDEVRTDKVYIYIKIEKHSTKKITSIKKRIGIQPPLQIYPLIFIIKFDIKTVFNCFQRCIQDPVKYLRWSWRKC